MRDVMEPLRVFESCDLAFIGDGPIVAFHPEDHLALGIRWMLSAICLRWRRCSVRFDPVDPSLACAASSIDFDRRIELLVGPTVLARGVQRPAPVVQGFSFLEWNMISTKNPYSFFELRLGIFVFPFSRRDDCL